MTNATTTNATSNGAAAPPAAPAADPAEAGGQAQGISAGEAVMAVCCLVAAGILAAVSIDVLRSGRRRDDGAQGGGTDGA